MASKHTSGYKLCQWEASDEVLRTDFNEDNSKIDAALKALDARALGVPALGRNLYNLFLRQKQAGQDVSWMEGLVYDDFTDQSKIESMGEGMSYSTAEKCIHFTPVNGVLTASLETTTQKLELMYSHAYFWLRHSLAQTPVVERWSENGKRWYTLEPQKNGSDYWSTTVGGEQCAECMYYQTTNLESETQIKLRITLTALNVSSRWPVKLYDYGCMLFQ